MKVFFSAGGEGAVVPFHVVFHADYLPGDYAPDPAAEPGRLDAIHAEIEKREAEGRWVVVEPGLASEEDVLRAHARRHVSQIKRDDVLYRAAMLAAGGAIAAADLAWDGKPAFAAVRPPGHHASRDHCWGFCYFNNLGVALLHLQATKGASSAFLLDFDLHFGDGNVDVLGGRREIDVEIFNPDGRSEDEYLEAVESELAKAGRVDVVAASAGFDQGIRDWGRLLGERAYERLGRLLRDYAEDRADGRRFAVLEGGYYAPDLGKHLAAFCDGFE
ncbi:MAG: hypothetical protein Kow0069_36070 [Promethearchaeota archaeon]